MCLDALVSTTEFLLELKAVLDSFVINWLLSIGLIEANKLLYLLFSSLSLKGLSFFILLKIISSIFSICEAAELLLFELS